MNTIRFQTIALRSAAIVAVIMLMAMTMPAAHASMLDWIAGSDSKTKDSLDLAVSYITKGQDDTKADTDTPVAKKAKVVATYSVTATAYSSTVDQCDNNPFITANGTHVHDGIIAANFLPFGTKVQIPQVFGDKIFTVEDRMNARFTDRIDVWFTDRALSNEFGIKHNVKIIVLSL